MTAAADKVPHGIIVTDMQKNGTIQNAFYKFTDKQQLSSEVEISGDLSSVLGPLLCTSRQVSFWVLHSARRRELFLPLAYIFYYV